MPPRVAVAHADDDVLMMLAEFLSEQGYQILPCYSSASLISIAQSTQPHLAVVDLELRTIQPSWELARRLRDDPCCRDMPLVALTAAPRLVPPRPQNCHSDCVIISEPFELSEFAGTIRSLLP